MKTCHAYINEYNLLDEVLEAVESAEKDINVAFFEYSKKKRNIENKSFFEYVENADLIIEKEGEGFLAKVGNTIIGIISKIADLIRDITGKLFKNTGLIKDDIEIVNKMIAKNPQLGKEIANGIKKEHFTYKDVAKFEKDITGLILMLEQDKIDHKTFRDKVTDALNGFNGSAKPIIETGATITALISIGPKVIEALGKSKKGLESIKSTASQFAKDVKTKYSEKDTSKVNAISWALGQATGILSRECKDNEESQGFFRKTLSFITTKKDDFLAKREEEEKNNAIKKAEKAKADEEKYYADMEEKIKKNKKHNERMREIRDRIEKS